MASKSRSRRSAAVSAVTGSARPAGEVPAIDRSPGGTERETAPGGGARSEWPPWARIVVSVLILYHGLAVVAGALGVPPSSMLERRIADAFISYYDLLDLGHAYRFYDEPPPTPVVTATVRYTGRPDETVRLPARSVSGPRMRHQRQLALANSLFRDVRDTKERTGDSSRSLLARAYARHLCATRPGCRSVIVHVQQHLIPEPDQVRDALRVPVHAPYDLFAESLFTTPEWVGEYSCDSF